MYFDIDPICQAWVLKSAGKKWRDFKSTLKKKYFNVNLTKEENIQKGCGNRIPLDEWEWLVDYWSMEEIKVCRTPYIHKQVLNLWWNNGTFLNLWYRKDLKRIRKNEQTKSMQYIHVDRAALLWLMINWYLVYILFVCSLKKICVVLTTYSFHDQDEILGRRASRAEVYIATHTRRDGRALTKECEEKIVSI